MERVAVTGSRGMVGQHMTALLAAEQIDHIALTRDDWDLSEWKELDELDALFPGVNAIFHIGAKLPSHSSNIKRETQLLFDANVRSCLNLSEWAHLRGVALIFLSGATVYENAHCIDIYEDNPKVVCGFGGFYGYSKWLAEQVIQHYVEQGLNAVILRPSSVYGYGLDNAKMIQHYLDVASTGGAIRIDQPTNRINFIHAIDVAKAALQAYEAKAWGVYNIAHPNPSSIVELAETITKVCGSGVIELNNVSHDGFLRFNLNCTKARNAFSFSPTVSLEEGLKLMKLKQVI